MIDISARAQNAIRLAIEQLAKDDRTSDTAVIDGLVMAATAVKFGYPVDAATKEAIRKALNNCGFPKIACDLLGPP